MKFQLDQALPNGTIVQDDETGCTYEVINCVRIIDYNVDTNFKLAYGIITKPTKGE